MRLPREFYADDFRDCIVKGCPGGTVHPSHLCRTHRDCTTPKLRRQAAVALAAALGEPQVSTDYSQGVLGRENRSEAA